jgi:hypothetical protein
MKHMNKPIWVLLYLIDSDAWWPHEAPHNPNYFPDVHTYCFESEEAAVEHQNKMKNPKDYRVKKTYLQTKEES